LLVRSQRRSIVTKPPQQFNGFEVQKNSMQNSLKSIVRALAVVCAGAFLAIVAPRQAAAGTIVHFDTNMGDFDVELFDSAAPITVNNFLNLLTAGRYNDTIVHRSVPGFVIQGGGFDAAAAAAISNFGSIPLEYSLPNTRGTIAMARTSNPNSATSQWFINTGNNALALAPGGSDVNGYAVFGQVLGNGMDVVDAINNLPKFAFNPPFNEIPLINYTQNDFSQGVNGLPHAVVVNSITIVPEPASLAIAGLGAIGIVGMALKSRRRPQL
jgi:cyclophilin family peptidyl-prolyl cis-trans isomerase